MNINPYWHDPHLPHLWTYQGSDQVTLRANSKTLDPHNAVYKATSLDLLFEPEKQEHLYALHNACAEHTVLPIAFRTWFLEDTSRIPKNIRTRRIYFAGTVTRHTFKTPCIPYMQRHGVMTDSGYELWSGGFSQLIPQVDFSTSVFIHL